jgi:hypothetical protein
VRQLPIEESLGGKGAATTRSPCLEGLLRRRAKD